MITLGTRSALALVVAALVAACGSGGTTAIELQIGYDDSWELTAIDVSAANASHRIAPAHELRVLLAQDAERGPVAIEVSGMRGDRVVALGSTTVDVHQGEHTDASVYLSLVAPLCSDTCTEGVCDAAGLVACTDTDGDGCRELAAVSACTSTDPCQVPSCRDGACTTTPMACGAGTCVDGACVYVPANVADVGHFEATGLDLDLAAGTAFDTTTQCATPSILGRCQAVPGSGFPLCVCRNDSIVIRDMTITGSRGLVLLASDRVTITGTVDVRAGADFITHGGSTFAGGAGGSFGSRGGNESLATHGSASLIPLLPGSGGQTGCSELARGGPGGGAIQISAGNLVTVSGRIEANGEGGTASSGTGSCLSGGGGGSGGAILVEAPLVTMSGILSATGGGGAGGSSNRHGLGDPGTPGRAGSGGIGGQGEDDHGCALAGYTSGGDGGFGSSTAAVAGGGGGPSDQRNCLDTEYLGAGGGGGGVGRIRINARTPFTPTGVTAPAPSVGALP